MLIENYPDHSLQVVHDRAIIDHGNYVSVNVMSDEQMNGKYGGQLRAEVNTRYTISNGQTHRHTFDIEIPKQDLMSHPLVIWQSKETGHSPTIALSWRDDIIYLKHRYTDENDVEHGPVLTGRIIAFDTPTEFTIEVKYEANETGYIKLFRNGQNIGEYYGKTKIETETTINIKFGLYMYGVSDGITSRKLIIHNAKSEQL